MRLQQCQHLRQSSCGWPMRARSRPVTGSVATTSWRSRARRCPGRCAGARPAMAAATSTPSTARTRSLSIRSAPCVHWWWRTDSTRRSPGENDRRISLLDRLIQHCAATGALCRVLWARVAIPTTERGRVAHESIFNINDGNYRCPNCSRATRRSPHGRAASPGRCSVLPKSLSSCGTIPMRSSSRMGPRGG